MDKGCIGCITNRFCKKKELVSINHSVHQQKARTFLYLSSLEADSAGSSSDFKPQFFSPEAFGLSLSLEDQGEVAAELQNMSHWDMATRYHELKGKRSIQRMAKNIRQLSASAILNRAQEIVGSIVRLVEQKVSPLSELPFYAEQAEFDLEETLESSPVHIAQAMELSHQDIWMSYHVRKQQSLVLCVDTSLSMTGEKLALTAVALAVVLLQFPDDAIGIVAFENEAQILKQPMERISVQLLVERFLDVPAQGYTHLEDGMRVACKLLRGIQCSSGRSLSTVLLTDGKYTAGKDPSYLASRFPHLIVLKMGREQASQQLCRDLAKRGKGVCKEVGELEALPHVMYSLVQDLLRGRSALS